MNLIACPTPDACCSAVLSCPLCGRSVRCVVSGDKADAKKGIHAGSHQDGDGHLWTD